MDALWWVPIGLVLWFGISLAAGLWLGPVLRYCSQVREVLDARMGDTLARAQSPPQKGNARPNGIWPGRRGIWPGT